MARKGIRLSDAQWKRIEPLLPKLPRSRHGGRRWIENRAVLDGILWVLKSGARWHDDGTWLRIWRSFLGQLDARGRLQWEEAFIDGTFFPAKKGAPTSAKPSVGRAQSAWWWETAKVFLWEFPSARPRPRKSGSRPRR